MDPILEVDPDRGLRIEWPDGHQSSLPLERLRQICPCAACREEVGRPAALRVLPSDPGAAARIARIAPVGRYAIQFTWGDGHDTGIYSWEYLRAHCGCLDCRLGRGMEV